MKKILRLSNIIPLLLVLFISKSFYIEPTLFDFGIIFLMSVSFLYKLNLDKQLKSDSDEILDKIAEFEERYKKDFKEIAHVQVVNRQEIESKLSTLNLAVQPRTAKQANSKTPYNWG